MIKKTLNLIIIGPQGSGKGTQARILSQKLDKAYFSMGEICKNARDRQDHFGQEAKKYYDNGKLYPEQLIRKLATDALKQLNYKNGIIFEGYPRAQRQLLDFNKILKKFKIDDPWVIYLDIHKRTIIKRLSARRICQNCNTPYVVSGKSEKLCNKCRGQLVIRPDDQPQAIKNRLEIFYKETLPIIHYYESINRLIKINGEPKVEPVNRQILDKLEKKKLL